MALLLPCLAAGSLSLSCPFLFLPSPAGADASHPRLSPAVVICALPCADPAGMQRGIATDPPPLYGEGEAIAKCTPGGL